MSKIYKEQADQNYFYRLVDEDEDGNVSLVIVDRDGDTRTVILTINLAGEIVKHPDIDEDYARDIGLQLDENHRAVFRKES